MDAEIAKKLREKFDVKQIGLKPKITCRACSKAPFKECGEHKKQQCRDCGQWITPRHMHVEFVGHANVTDRLLEVDPGWTWEPVGFDERGLPALDANGGLWIRLTVAGVTRIGYGGADGKEGDDAVKEAISDAIKVTAMRFGVGLDLWRKEEASGKTTEEPTARQNGAQQRRTPPPDGQPTNGAPDGQASAGAVQGALRFVRRTAEKHGIAWDDVKVQYARRFEGEVIDDATDPNRLTAFAKLLVPAEAAQ